MKLRDCRSSWIWTMGSYQILMGWRHKTGYMTCIRKRLHGSQRLCAAVKLQAVHTLMAAVLITEVKPMPIQHSFSQKWDRNPRPLDCRRRIPLLQAYVDNTAHCMGAQLRAVRQYQRRARNQRQGHSGSVYSACLQLEAAASLRPAQAP